MKAAAENKKLVVSQEALLHNWRRIREQLPADTKVLINLKADAYGLGAVPMGKFFENRAAYYSVAQAGEGRALRQAGIRTPVMVYNPPVEPDADFFEIRLEPVLYHPDQIRRYVDIATAMGLQNYPVHIKLNTGMNRSGLQPEDMAEVWAMLGTQTALRPVSLFSHLAAADDPAEDAFTQAQIEKFDALSVPWKKRFPALLRHVANTAAIFRFPEAHYDMVRPGISIYGYHTLMDMDPGLRPAVRLLGRITQTRRLKPGDTVGYNRTFRAKRPMEIALIPLGYADGIRRMLSNGPAYVRCGRHRCPFVGRVSMDMITVDITGSGARIGDWAEIIGEDPTVEQYARWYGTIPYEVLTSLDSRIPRIFE